MSYSYKNLVERLLDGKLITIKLLKHDVEEPFGQKDLILYDRVLAEIKRDNSGNKDISVSLQKEDEKEIYETYELYRIPIIKNKNMLIYILKEIRKQSHFP